MVDLCSCFLGEGEVVFFIDELAGATDGSCSFAAFGLASPSSAAFASSSESSMTSDDLNLLSGLTLRTGGIEDESVFF